MTTVQQKFRALSGLPARPFDRSPPLAAASGKHRALYGLMGLVMIGVVAVAMQVAHFI